MKIIFLNIKHIKFSYEVALWLILVIIPIPSLMAQDSLADKSYEELDRLSIDAFYNNQIAKSHVYSDYYIQKAKAAKDSLEVGLAFYGYILSSENEVAIQYADSTIMYTRNSPHKSYPAYGYLVKGRLLFEQGKMDESLQAFLEANKSALTKQNDRQLLSVKFGIAAIKNYIGEFSEALALHKEIYAEIIAIPNYKEVHFDDYKKNLSNISLSYLRAGALDSAQYYCKLAMKETLNKDSLYYVLQASNNAIIEYYKENYNAALDTLLKYYKTFDRNSLANKLYYIGKSFQAIGKNEQAMKYFESVDSVVKATNDPFPEIKDVYQQLMLQQKKKGDTQSQLKYINDYIWADSVLSSSKEKMMAKINLDYDTPRIIAEKTRLQALAKKNRTRLIWSSVIGALIFISGIFLFYRYRRTIKRIRGEINKNVVYDIRSSSDVKINKKHFVPKEIEIVILEGIGDFERNRGYLDKNLTVPKLAKTIGTNDTYLSNVINNQKGVHFPTYLKNLRINHAVASLKNNHKLLRYSVKGLAQEFGFKTEGAFSTAFKERVGVKPSIYIRELRRKKANN